MLARLDVALYIDVYLWPERSQRRFRGEEVVHELLVVPSDVIARLLDAQVLCPHQHGDEVVAFQTAVEFHVIGIQVLEGFKRENDKSINVQPHYQGARYTHIRPADHVNGAEIYLLKDRVLKDLFWKIYAQDI